MENVKEANGDCPFCQQKPSGFIDKRFERQLNELKVYCIYKPKGCDWVGNFCKIEQHLSIGEENGECQFVVVECPVSIGCKECIPRKKLENHVNNSCKYRQTQCMYCGFLNTYQNITTSHPKQCTKFPLHCPNECSDQTYPRDQLDTHLASCPEQEVDCTFSEMGCKEKIKRRVLQEHLDTNLLQHQLIMCQAFKEMKKDKQEAEEQLKLLQKSKQEVEEQLEVLKNSKQEVEEQLELLKIDKTELEVKIQDTLKLSNQEDNQIKSLKYIVKTNDQLQSAYFSKMFEFSYVNPVAPIVFRKIFEIHLTQQTGQRSGIRNADHYTAIPYRSQFFYSHSDGYKLQLSAEVICHCLDCRIQQIATAIYRHQPIDAFWHVENFYDHPGMVAFAVNLHIFEGEHDSQLRWPFKEEVTITMYQTDDDNNPVGRMVDDKNPDYIPHAVAIFEGNRNYTSTSLGSKLNIKEKKKTNSLEQTLNKIQQRSHILTDQGLLIPLDLRHCKPSRYNNVTIYFEVTFSP